MQQDEPVAALRALVERASASVDERLKGVTLGSLGFLRHCEALKSLLLFAQGDFLSELLKHTADLLPRRASEVPLPPPLLQFARVCVCGGGRGLGHTHVCVLYALMGRCEHMLAAFLLHWIA